MLCLPKMLDAKNLPISGLGSLGSSALIILPGNRLRTSYLQKREVKRKFYEEYTHSAQIHDPVLVQVLDNFRESCNKSDVVDGVTVLQVLFQQQVEIIRRHQNFQVV
jgi:hypothetical protein